MGLLLGLFFLFFSAACSQTDNEQSVNTIRVAVLPDDGMKKKPTRNTVNENMIHFSMDLTAGFLTGLHY